ncbi:hypothetical protein ACFW3D_30965 [Streptomyces sp. NPDC058864]
MTNWARLYDSYGTAERVPVLLGQVESETEAGSRKEAWAELWDRLCLEGEATFSASFAALPRLVTLARRNPAALDLAEAIVRSAKRDHHRAQQVLVNHADVVAQLRDLVDRRLRSRPSDYLWGFRSLLAIKGQFHWSAVLDDFSDDFYHVPCPHCAVPVTVAIGGYGHYSAFRDWDRGDVDRRPLRPASPAELDGIGRWMHDTAVRDGQDRLADGIRYLFGRAECPRCAGVFCTADEYTAAHLPPAPCRLRNTRHGLVGPSPS